MAKSNKLRCRLYCKEANFDLDVPDFSEDTLASIFANQDYLTSLSFRFSVPPEYSKWLLEEPDIAKVFLELADFLKLPVTRLIQLYFFYVVNEDQSAYQVFADSKYIQKKAFVQAFRDFNAKFIENPAKIKNPIAPDILYCLTVYVLLYQYPQIDTFEVPMHILLYILNIENEAVPPKNFDPNIPYESDVIADEETSKILKKKKKLR